MIFRREILLSLISKNVLYLFSVFISVGLWFYVLSTEPLSIDKEVPLNIGVATDRSIGTLYPKKVKLTLSGPKAFIRELMDDDLGLYFNLVTESRNIKNTHTLDIVKGLIDLPLGVVIQKADPPELTLKFVKRKSKEIKIVPSTVGNVQDKHKLTLSKMNPPSIKVYGPSDVLKNLKSLKTKPIEISNLKGQGQLEAYIENDDPRVEIENKNVLYYEYSIRPTQANLQINNVKIRFLSSKKVVSSTAKEVSLLVLSEKDKDTRINPEDVRVIADIPENSKGKVKVKLKVDLPNELYLIKIQPEEIFVRVK